MLHPHERFPDNHAGKPPHHHADSHLHIGETLILSEQRTGQSDETVRYRETSRDHGAVGSAQGPDHLSVVAGSAHGGSQIRSEKRVKDQASDDNRRKSRREPGGVPNPDLPAHHVDGRRATQKTRGRVLHF